MSTAEEEMSEGEAVELTPENSGVQDTDDGGAIVNLEDAKSVEEVKSFYANLAEDMDQSEMSTLGLNLSEFIAEDRQARKKRDEQYEEAIKKSGLGADAGGGTAFPGSSKIVHPMLVKGCIDFGARTVKELLPASNIVKDFIPGKMTRERLEKAKRKTAYMNWQLKTQMPEFRTEMEQLFTQLPLGGSQYLAITYDRRRKRPVAQFWPIDDVLIPSSAANFYTAERMTLIERITQNEYEARFTDGLYAGEPDVAPAAVPEVSGANEAQSKIEGKEDTGQNLDGLREIFRIRIRADLEKKGMRPYIVEMDAEDDRILSIIRNWEKEDKNFEQMDWVIDFTFLYWKGAVGVGLYHLIGSLSISATGAIRALLDSAHINNLPTLLKLKGTNTPGQTLNLNFGEVNEIQGGVGADPDIRKLMMAIPFNPPSVVLLQLLGMITEFGESVVRTTFDGFADGRQDVPVGTMMAMIEQGMKVLGSIHLRLYASMTRVLSVLARVNRMYLDSAAVATDTGEVLAKREDFVGPEDVIPVADPETFSDVQRMAQVQMISQRALLLPQLYDLRKVEELILERSKIPDAKELLLPALKPKIMNAVNENVSMSLGQPVTAHPEQDHLAHLQILVDYAMSPVYGMNPLIAPAMLPAALNHAKEHLIYHYVERMKDVADELLKEDVTKAMQHEDMDTRNELDRLMAAISTKVVPEGPQTFEKLMPALQQIMQIAQQVAPPPPTDPKLGAAQIQAQSKAEDRKSKDAIEQGKMQLKAQELAQKGAEGQAKVQTEQERLVQDLQKARDKMLADFQRDQAKQAFDGQQTERQLAANAEAQAAQQAHAAQLAAEANATALRKQQLGDLAKEQMNDQDNQVALAIAEAEIESGEKVAVENGKGIDP